MFKSDAERNLTKLTHNIQRHIGILNIVIGEFFAVKLARRSQ